MYTKETYFQHFRLLGASVSDVALHYLEKYGMMAMIGLT